MVHNRNGLHTTACAVYPSSMHYNHISLQSSQWEALAQQHATSAVAVHGGATLLACGCGRQHTNAVFTFFHHTVISRISRQGATLDPRALCTAQQGPTLTDHLGRQQYNHAYATANVHAIGK